ncbi:MAG: ABC transporter substrate-binding protein [Spirochaetaceae bacterium]
MSRVLNRKVLILISSAIVIVLIVILTVFSNKKTKKLSGELTLVIDQGQNNVNLFNDYILNIFCNGNDVTGRLVINTKENYLDFITKNLNADSSTDIFYGVYSSQLFSSVRESGNSHLFKTNISDSIPDSLYSFSNYSNRYFYVPITWSPWGMYYNKDIFRKFGLEEPKTLDDLEKINQLLLENGVTPYSMVQKLQWPLTAWFDYINLRYNGSSFHSDLLNGYIDFTDTRVLKVYKEIYRMIKSNYFKIDYDNYEWTSMLDTLGNESTAMVLGSTFYYEKASRELKDKLGWFAFPNSELGKEYQEVVTSSGYFVNSNTDNIDAVTEFLKYSLSNSSQLIIKEYTQFYPVNERILKKYNNPDLDEAYKQIEGADKLIPSFERNNNKKLHIVLKSSISSLFKINSEQDIKVILEKLEDIRLKKIK